ncbi:MAG: hypothetical protein PHI12_08755 [Dehalococcoidales bacterium]|nr:hypothetical protein [Dehalococcoidales bacterium]
MATKDWRISNWVNPVVVDVDSTGNPNETDIAMQETFEAGASAMHKASVDYLEGKCTEHLCNSPLVLAWIDDGEARPLHRRDCPICYAAWEGE